MLILTGRLYCFAPHTYLLRMCVNDSTGSWASGVRTQSAGLRPLPMHPTHAKTPGPAHQGPAMLDLFLNYFLHTIIFEDQSCLPFQFAFEFW